MTRPTSRQASLTLAATALALAAGAVQAQTAARDSRTGPFRAPTPAEAQAMAQPEPAQRIGMRTGKVNPGPIHYRDGTVEQELDASTMSYTVAQVNPDGSISMVCVTGDEAAKKALKAPMSKRITAKSGAKEHQHVGQ